MGKHLGDFYRFIQRKTAKNALFFILIWVVTRPLEDHLTRFMYDIASENNVLSQAVWWLVAPYGLTGLLIVVCLLGIVLHSYISREWEDDKTTENNIEKIPSLITAIDDLENRVKRLELEFHAENSSSPKHP